MIGPCDQMNRKHMTLAIAAIVAAVVMTGVASVVPHQALAYGHHQHHSNTLKVSQAISQANFCTNQSLCVNQADNTFGPPSPLVVWH